jgi:hypothetical protein
MVKSSPPPRHRHHDNDGGRIRPLETKAKRRASSNLPGMDSTAKQQQQVAGVAGALCARTDDVAVRIARSISHEVALYQSAIPVPFNVVVAACTAHVPPIFGAIAAGRDFDVAAAKRLGAERARDGVPLASVMEAYRVGFRRAWEIAADEAATRPDVGRAALQALTTKLMLAQDIYTSSMSDSYRNEQTRRLLREDAERATLVDALLHGRLLEQWSLWEVADYLRLPNGGPYVVIAAEVPAVGHEAFPDVESKLRSLDVFSAWRLLPDLQVGIIHVNTDKHLDDSIALLSRIASTRVGVSAKFGDLRDTAQALRYARVMLRSKAEPDLPVSVFDGSVLTSAAVSAPDVMTKLVTPILDSFAGMTDEERAILFQTFRVWVDNDGSLRTTGELLFCHPNTVRYRLHRIEQRTGRLLSRPRDVAELCLALEVHRRLM